MMLPKGRGTMGKQAAPNSAKRLSKFGALVGEPGWKQK
jgi:hypothetical protein